MTTRRKLFIGLGTLIAIAAFLVAARLLSNDALEKYKRQLRARGEKLDLADYRPTRDSANDKGSADWLAAAQRLDTSPPVPASEVSGMHSTAPGEARVLWAQPAIRLIDSRNAKEFSWSDLSNQ